MLVFKFLFIVSQAAPLRSVAAFFLVLFFLVSFCDQAHNLVDFW
nr:MAG TPA: hypothetical protein [Caudoviricetes sp.]